MHNIENMCYADYSFSRNISEYSQIHAFDINRYISDSCYNGLIVDLGCGDGTFLSEIKQAYPDSRVIGVDIRNSNTKLNDAEFIRSNVASNISSILEGSVDLVVSTCVPQWIGSDKVDSFYVEINRILSEQGIALIFPSAPRSFIKSRGESFVGEYGFDRSISLRNVGRVLPQTVIGDSLKIKPYFI